MDRLQVIEVEIDRRHGLDKSLGDELAFCRLKCLGVRDVQPVAENDVVGRIAVVAVAHSAAATRPRSRIRRTIWARRRSGDHPSRSNIWNRAISSAVRGMPSIACKCAASTSRPFGAALVPELESRCILNMVRPFNVAAVKATGACTTLGLHETLSHARCENRGMAGMDGEVCAACGVWNMIESGDYSITKFLSGK